MVLHELRSPLHGILGLANTLSQDLTLLQVCAMNETREPCRFVFTLLASDQNVTFKIQDGPMQILGHARSVSGTCRSSGLAD